MAEPAIKIKGLKEFQKAIKSADSELPKVLRQVLNTAADSITNEAKSRVPVRSGRAMRSLKSKSTQTMARVGGGGARAPYYPWLDFGGSVGKGGSVRRPLKKRGRYLYYAYFKQRDSGKFEKLLEDGLRDVARRAGMELD